MIVAIISLFFVFLIGLLTAVYYFKTNCRHRKRRDDALALIDSESYKTIPDSLTNTYRIVVQRRYEHIMTYFNFQVINKVFGFMSILLSLIVFIGELIKDTHSYIDDISIPIVSFLSILCVIIALYISPSARVSDYINAWREDEIVINTMTAKLDVYKTISIDAAKEESELFLNRLSEIEKSIKSDEI